MSITTTAEVKRQRDEINHLISEFQATLALHPNFETIMDEVIDHIFNPDGEPLIFIYGPSHVGKSRLLIEIAKKLLEWFNTHGKPGTLPFIALEIPKVRPGKFNWGDLYHRILRAGREPLIDCKQLFRHEKVSHGEALNTFRDRRAAESMLQNRKPPAIIFDEGMHMNNPGPHMSEEEHMDTIKSLTNMAGPKLVIAGTYDLLKLSELSAQLCNRTREFHFPRYHFNIKEERLAFMGAMKSFALDLPLKNPLGVMDEWEFCYARCVGCPGDLKKHLSRALRLALIEGSDLITRKHLEASAHSISKCAKKLREANAGEHKLITSDAMSRAFFAEVFSQNSGKDKTTTEKEKMPPKPKKKKNSFGKPKPRRYPIDPVKKFNEAANATG